MWIHTTAGFLSIVADPNDAGLLLVRTRDYESMQALLDGVELIAGHEPPEIRVGEGTDYPYRSSVSRVDLAAYMGHEILNYITYPNFKTAVKESRGEVWASALMQTWVAMLKVTDPGVRDLGYFGAQSDNPHYWTNRGSEDPSPYDALLESEYDDLEPHRWSREARDWLEEDDD